MEKNRQVKWSSQAQIDFNNSIDYILGMWGVEITERFINAVQSKINLITKFPEIGREVQFPSGCRKALIKPYYLLFYKYTRTKIEIVRLFDGRRNPIILKTSN